MSGEWINMGLHRQYGFNLIEALIALVVLTMGLLGIAAMQLTTIRNTQGSYYRSQATAIANDVAERIHVNNPNFSNYVINPTVTASSCGSAPGSGATVAAQDTYDMSCGGNGATQLLPSGSIQVVCINSASSVTANCTSESNMRMQINVGWQERGTVQQSSSSAAMDALNLENQSITLIIQP